jgi:hypothetical protein
LIFSSAIVVSSLAISDTRGVQLEDAASRRKRLAVSLPRS